MEDKQHEWWTHATAQQEVIITGSTASMKWETTNDWNTIVIPNDLYVTFSGLISEETFSVNNTAARIRLRTVADSRRTPRSIENSVRSIPRAHTVSLYGAVDNSVNRVPEYTNGQWWGEIVNDP
ncbi:uncharacterized protein LOC117151154 [Bombus impatiens]|uniref:Uncharacterized protein LOC117151154 n=1 Tax=Bombus impatiens TaxID=132113 RepID=A0A6P8KYR9_BOMIM|nr:uncharacterized protein LOC117151154 [Bombus impatiens]